MHLNSSDVILHCSFLWMFHLFYFRHATFQILVQFNGQKQEKAQSQTAKQTKLWPKNENRRKWFHYFRSLSLLLAQQKLFFWLLWSFYEDIWFNIQPVWDSADVLMTWIWHHFWSSAFKRNLLQPNSKPFLSFLENVWRWVKSRSAASKWLWDVVSSR